MRLDLRKHYEGLHDGDLSKIGLQPKMDPAGIWTEGYGKAMIGSDGKFLKGVDNKEYAYSNITIHNEAEALKDLEIRTMPIMQQVQRKLTIDVTDYQMEALIGFVDNAGISRTLFKLVNEKSPLLYKWWTTHYITGQGNPKPLPGLVARRKTEATLFTTGKLIFFN